MFEKIRKPAKSKSFFSYLVFGFIAIIFIFLGIPNNSFLTGGGYAVRVGRENISIIQFQRVLDQVQSQKKSSSPQNAKRQLKEDQKRVLSGLIQNELIYQAGKEASLYISDPQLRKGILSIKAFQEEGRFKRTKYLNYLEWSRTSSGDFEKELRKDILVNRVQNLFDHAFVVSNLEKQQNTALNNYKIHLKYVKILMPSFNSEKEIQRWTQAVQSLSSLESELTKSQLKWMDVKPTSLQYIQDAIPGIEGDSLFEDVIQVYPGEGLIPRLYTFSDGNVAAIYLKKIQQVQTKSQYLDSIESILSFSLSRMRLNAWLDQKRENTSLAVNPRLLDTEDPI